MAANVTKLPPRGSRKLDEKTIMRNRSSLDTLLQMGFPRNRIEKALAATGDKGIQLASNWLISHVNDPTLDDPMPRDYILYMCPVGLLQQEMLDFWQQSYLAGDWNRAHNYFPHITLCSFFKADDSLVSKLTHTLKTVADQFDNTPESIQLEYFSSTNFMGLFVSDECALRLRQITADYAVAVKKLGVTVEPHSKQLHVSLAYQFVTDVREQLESLARKINLNAPARWDLRLYSRDPRIAHCQVRKVTCAYTPREPDELNLCEGDFIVMSESELDNSADGWYQGMSWQMGCSGIFPGICTQRVAETETWTMHRSIPIIGTGVEVPVEENGAAENTPVTVAKAMRPPRQITRLPSHTYDNVSVLNTSVVKRTKKNTPPSGGGETNAHGAQVTKASCSSERTHSPTPSTHSNSSQGRLPEKTRGSDSRTSSSKSAGVLKDVGPVGNRQLYVMRHGERIDFTFGKDWINNSFDQSGNYIRYDLNMPKCLPKRKGGAQDFYNDSPLTVQGHFQAKLVGEALAEKQVPISHVYVSPSLRCVETATSLLEGLGVSRPLHVEPGLFEWLGWYTSGLPKFMSVQELMDCGFRINPTYKCHWTESKFNPQETTEQYYDRCHYVTREILSARENEGGNVLLVAHAASLEVCTRRLLGRAPRSKTAFYDVLHKVPYCSLAVAQEACLVRDTWYLIEPPVLPFAHSNNPKYNWTTLTSPDHG